MTERDSQNGDDRLPLRWAVILLGAIGAGVGAGYLGGPLAGWGVAVATTALPQSMASSVE